MTSHTYDKTTTALLVIDPYNDCASPNNALICLRSAIAWLVNRRCWHAFWFPLGAPDPGAPPCMRQRLLPRTEGERHEPPERILAPQRGLASMAAVLGA